MLFINMHWNQIYLQVAAILLLVFFHFYAARETRLPLAFLTFRLPARPP